MTDTTAQDESRSFTFTTGGNDDNDGRTYNRAVASPEVGRDKCLALIPPPAIFQQAALINPAAGGFATQLDQLDSIQVDAPAVNLNNPSDPYTVSLGNATNFSVTTITNAAAGGSAVLVDGVSRSGLDMKFLSATGLNGVSLKVQGSIDNIFLNVGQISAVYTGVQDTGTSADPVSYRLNEITLDANNAVGFDFSGTGIRTLQVGSIVNTGAVTGTTAIIASSGNLDILSTRIDSDLVFAGSSISTINCNTIDGDITIESGATVFGNIAQHTGNLFFDGKFTGCIGVVKYSHSVIVSNRITQWTAPGAIAGSYDTIGRISIDSGTYKLDGIDGYFTKTNVASHTVDFQLINEDTLDVYYSGSVGPTTTTGLLPVTLSAGVAFPSSGDVNLAFQVQRSSGGVGGVSDPSGQLSWSVR